MRDQGISYPQRDRICARLKQLSSSKGLEMICLYVKYILTVSSLDQYINFLWRIWRDDDSGVSNINDWWAKILPWTSNQANKECHICESRKNISNIYWINLGWLKPNQYTHIVHAPPLVVANLVTHLNGSNTTRASNDDRMQPSPLRHQHCHMQMLSLNQQCWGSGIGGSGPHQKR